MSIGRKLVITLLVLLCFLGGALHGAYAGWKYYARTYMFSKNNFHFENSHLGEVINEDINDKGNIALHEHVIGTLKKRYIFDVENPREDIHQTSVIGLVLIYGRLAMLYERNGQKELSEKKYKSALKLVKKYNVLSKYNITSSSELKTYINELDNRVKRANIDNQKDGSYQ